LDVRALNSGKIVARNPFRKMISANGQRVCAMIHRIGVARARN
jgi:hypothetical protein